jgi:esterase/lipase superfamily enzyme
MKVIFSLLMIIHFSGCAFLKSSKGQTKKLATNNNAPAVTSEVIVEAPAPAPAEVLVPAPIPEVVMTLDEKIQTSLKPLLLSCLNEDFSETRTIDILVVTNRKQKGKFFGCTDNQFGVDLDPQTQFGMCRINVPKNHIVGQIPIAKNNRQSSHDYFKFLGAKSYNEETFLEIIKKRNRTPLVFVHGFNVRYQEAVMRAAQIAYDLKYQGPVILFSWPAGSGDGFFDDKFLNKTYEQNAKSAVASIVPFKKFLQLLKNAEIKINLGVHSMGHQMVLPALKDLGNESDVHLVNELILNAPDYHADDFVELTDVIKNLARRMTLYCSFNDKAMIASKTVNNGDRLGACTYSENVDSINVSLIDDDTFALGHGYYSSRAILNDIFQLLLGIDADRRLFIRRSEPNSTEKYFLRP